MSVVDELLSTAVSAATPEKIKIEWRYLPDWLIDFTGSSQKSSKFIELTRPKVYVRTKSGYEIGYDLYERRTVKVPPDAFTPGKFQSFVSSPQFKQSLLILLGLWAVRKFLL